MPIVGLSLSSFTRRLLAQTLQQDAGDALHPGDVVDALAVVDLHDLAEDADHDLVVLLPVIEPVSYTHLPTPSSTRF